MIDKNKTAAIILAAGKGKRMKSDLPKVMHLVNGSPLIEYAWKNIYSSDCFDKIVVVVPNDSNLVQDYLGDRAQYAIQIEQLGTGHAVMAAESTLLGKADTVAVFYGDMPFLRPGSIKNLIETHKLNKNILTFITVKVDSFDGQYHALESYGRVIRKEDGKVEKIKEKKDCNEEELKISEVNTAFCCFQGGWLWNNLKKLETNNSQKEYYLTDLVEMAIMDGEKVGTIEIEPKESMGINSAEDLIEAQKFIK